MAYIKHSFYEKICRKKSKWKSSAVKLFSILKMRSISDIHNPVIVIGMNNFSQAEVFNFKAGIFPKRYIKYMSQKNTYKSAVGYDKYSPAFMHWNKIINGRYYSFSELFPYSMTQSEPGFPAWMILIEGTTVVEDLSENSKKSSTVAYGNALVDHHRTASCCDST